MENAAEPICWRPTPCTPGSPVAADAYFISQGEPVNCWQWIDEILALAGLPPVRKSISFRAAWALGAGTARRSTGCCACDGEPPMTRFLAAQLGRSHYFDISAARRDFGYQPRVSTAEGMRRLRESLVAKRSEGLLAR